MARVLGNAAGLAGKGHEFSFTDQDFNQIRQAVSTYCGIALADHKRQLVYSRLSRRLRELGLRTFEQYCGLLDGSNPQEIIQLVNAITTNVTAFFRESHHFDFLAQTLVPQFLESDQKRLRIWSAGCSSGEEPYSIAMTLADVLGDRKIDAKVLATDIDANTLAKAKAGIYSMDAIKTISLEQRRRWFERGGGGQEGKVRVNEKLKKWISFASLNLMQEWPMHGPFDAIFCRNVVIYFDKPTKTRLFDRYADLLRDGGYLFLGHSESMHGMSNRFNLIGRTIYRKNR